MNRIIWVRWVDPLAHLVHLHKEEEDFDEVLARAARDTFLDDDESRYDDTRPPNGPIGPAVIGPLGIIPLREDNLPGKLFNFWMGHTNFDLSEPVVDAIQAVPGVETLDVFTRYRFRLGIGKAFKQDEVKGAIEALCRPPKQEPPRPQGGLEAVKSALRKRFKHWAIYVMPNGRVEVAGGETVEEVKDKGRPHETQAKEVVVSW